MHCISVKVKVHLVQTIKYTDQIMKVYEKDILNLTIIFLFACGYTGYLCHQNK